MTFFIESKLFSHMIWFNFKVFEIVLKNCHDIDFISTMIVFGLQKNKFVNAAPCAATITFA